MNTSKERKAQSAGSEYRNALLTQCAQFLQNRAYEALYIEGFANSQFVVLCVQVDDALGKEIADAIMPKENWQDIRDKGQDPIIRGTATFNMCYALAERIPEIKKELIEVPEENMVKAIVIAENGCSVFDITPTPAHGLN